MVTQGLNRTAQKKGIKKGNNGKHKDYYNSYDKRFYINNIKSCPHDENLYLFKRDPVNKIITTPIELLIKLGLDSGHESKEALINNILELTINDDRKLFEAAVRLNIDLS